LPVGIPKVVGILACGRKSFLCACRRFMLLVGDSTGSVRLIYRNGTQRQSVFVGGPITAMHRNNNQLAIAVDGAMRCRARMPG
jgi:hypothetical protein